MYSILGNDGQQYGPVDLATLKQWLAEGRVNQATQVQAQGTTDWRALSTFPEFASVPAGVTPAAAPPTVVAAAPPKTNGLAITSLVLGFVSLLCGLFASIPGLICGIIALKQIKKGGPKSDGKGLAIAGVCICSLMLLFNLLFIGVMIHKMQAIMQSVAHQQ